MMKKTEFESIEIIIDYNVDRPPECRGSQESYSIYGDGTISYCVCYECSVLDKNIDREHVEKVVSILETVLDKIKKKYGVGR